MLQTGAKQLLHQAIQAELSSFMANFAGQTDQQGRPLVVRNGYLPQRKIVTGIGSIPIQVPKVRSRGDEAVCFRSSMLPPYVRRSKSVDVALPWLYLKGISAGDMKPALSALLGSESKGLSASVINRLKTQWHDDYEQWRRRRLDKDKWVYLWVDGIYSNLRDDDKLCALVVIGANAQGQKRLLAVEDGVRESKQSWREVLLDLQARGLKDFKLAIGDGALGFWAAVSEIYPDTKRQRCCGSQDSECPQ
ncbi:transposase [Elysia marginata]|uniref:Transposase n=1 Tax=Elysia marginata TaxID=1093978 RepID=A0AAV4GXC5_9GAST|nr:transposase [Elysia marginata]